MVVGTCAYVRIRHTSDKSAYVRIRQLTSALVRIRQHTSAYVSIRQQTSAYVRIRQQTLAYVRKRVSYVDKESRLKTVAQRIVAEQRQDFVIEPRQPVQVFSLRKEKKKNSRIVSVLAWLVQQYKY